MSSFLYFGAKFVFSSQIFSQAPKQHITNLPAVPNIFNSFSLLKCWPRNCEEWTEWTEAWQRLSRLVIHPPLSDGFLLAHCDPVPAWAWVPIRCNALALRGPRSALAGQDGHCPDLEWVEHCPCLVLAF